MEATWLKGGEPYTWCRDDRTVYRVRIWVPPRAPGTGWFVDDWSVTDADDVTAVIAWAKEEAARLSGGTFEVFTQAVDHGVRADGVLAEQVHHIRVYGTPGDTAVTETVVVLRRD